jgi:hypothetical protein
MAADKTFQTPSSSAENERDQAKVSEDLTRIVSFLDNRASSVNKRAAGLSEEIIQRREESAGRSNPRLSKAFESRLDDLAQSIPDRQEQSISDPSNPDISIKYHTFCRDLDALLDSFRARVASTKPIQH